MANNQPALSNTQLINAIHENGGDHGEPKDWSRTERNPTQEELLNEIEQLEFRLSILENQMRGVIRSINAGGRIANE